MSELLSFDVICARTAQLAAYFLETVIPPPSRRFISQDTLTVGAHLATAPYARDEVIEMKLATAALGPWVQNDLLLPEDEFVELFLARQTFALAAEVAKQAPFRAQIFGSAKLQLPTEFPASGKCSNGQWSIKSAYGVQPISVRLLQAYDINTDRFPCRADLLFGWK